MALNQNDKDLLAVCRYFNKEVENKHVARLVAKLLKDFNLDNVRALTGFSENEIKVLVASVAPKTKKHKTLPEVSAERRKASEVIDSEPETRLAIHLNAESDLVQRVAYDVSKAIESELQPGDMYWNVREIMERFSCGSATVTKANRILVSYNWIQNADESNKRKGYIVK